MEPPETIYVEDTTVGCDGGGGAQGHPKVFLNLAEKGSIDCPYCGQRFAARAAGDGDSDGGGGAKGG
ncbi:MAG: zinc-finger domain-containing protein [Proteobacteria bacterium]|nr:zinc-finger domain-containing protein [Pseudomonadota bacterium]